MLDKPENAIFINALINFGQNLSLRIIAKGVETQAQLEHLKLQACDGAQGFLFSRPLLAEDFSTLLRSERLRWRSGT